MSNQVKLRLMMDVVYAAPMNVSAQQLRDQLYRATSSAIGLGLLTDRGDVEVDEHAMDVVVLDDGELPPSVQQFKDSLESCRGILDGLSSRYAEVVNRGPAPVLEALLTKYVDELSLDLSSRAANACTDDADAQDVAVSAVESWVSSNVSSDTTSRLAAVLWVKGLYAGTVELLRWLQ